MWMSGGRVKARPRVVEMGPERIGGHVIGLNFFPFYSIPFSQSISPTILQMPLHLHLHLHLPPLFHNLIAFFFYFFFLRDSNQPLLIKY